MRSVRPLSDRLQRRRLRRRHGGRGGLRRESIADGAMARSLVADLSGRTAQAIATNRTRPGMPAPLTAAPPPWIDELAAAFLRFDGHADTAPAFDAAVERAKALAAAARDDEEALRSAALGFAADALTAVLVERACSNETAKEMVATAAEILEMSAATVS